MFNYFKELFNNNVSDEKEISNSHKLEIAACALLIQIANADDNFSDTEEAKLYEVMKKRFSLTEDEVSKIISQSEKEIEKSISIYEFTDILNKNLSSAEKYSIVKNLWHIAYADGNIDTYEDHFIKTITNNLHIYNKDRIAAKLEVKEGLGL